MIAKGGCHCGAVRFRADIDTSADVLDCNCSVCSMTGFMHVIVPHADFELLQGQEALTSYRFGTGKAEHLFCQHCGVKSFYQPRSHPDCWSVNFHCLDQGHGWTPDPVTFDGRNWEQSASAIAQKPSR